MPLSFQNGGSVVLAMKPNRNWLHCPLIFTNRPLNDLNKIRQLSKAEITCWTTKTLQNRIPLSFLLIIHYTKMHFVKSPLNHYLCACLLYSPYYVTKHYFVHIHAILSTIKENHRHQSHRHETRWLTTRKCLAWPMRWTIFDAIHAG